MPFEWKSIEIQIENEDKYSIILYEWKEKVIYCLMRIYISWYCWYSITIQKNNSIQNCFFFLSLYLARFCFVELSTCSECSVNTLSGIWGFQLGICLKRKWNLNVFLFVICTSKDPIKIDGKEIHLCIKIVLVMKY